MNLDQKRYLIGQIRAHAQWAIDNTRMSYPIEWTQQEIHEKLEADGYTIYSAPLYDVGLPPTEEMQRNIALITDYMNRVNYVTGQYIDNINRASEGNPVEILNSFVAEVATLQVEVPSEQ